jgi:acyl-homoserine lactone acylase PvdQ
LINKQAWASYLFSLILIFAASLAWTAPPGQANFTDVTKFFKGGKTLEIPALTGAVRLITDRDGVRHIETANDFDLAIASGYVHCRDRLFQMDQTHRQVDGTEAEGKLHRIVFDHPFEDAFNIPPQAGFKDLSPELPGLARDGCYEVVNRSGFSARAQDHDSFMFGHGSVRRYVGQARRGPSKIAGVNVVPGGPSGIPGDPNYATQLGTWLTTDYHAVEMGVSIPHGLIVKRETFVSAP